MNEYPYFPSMRNIIVQAKERPFIAALAVLVGAGLLIGLASAIIAVRQGTGLRSGGASLSYDAAEPGFAVGMPGIAVREEKAVMRGPDSFPAPMPPTAGETAASVDQKIIKTGYLRVVVNDVNVVAQNLAAYAASIGGFVEHSSVVEHRDGTRSGNVVLRVPVARFEAALGRVREEARLVREETVQGQDVTEQYADLEAQLRNARAQEASFLQILAQARTVEDILKVQVQLGQIRERIEMLEGRLQYLENRTSFSTVTVQLEEEAAIRVPLKEFRPVEAAKAAVQALLGAFQSFVIGLIWTIILGIGLGVPLALVLWLVWKLARRFLKF